MMKFDRKGFTLIELVVVLVIVGISACIIIPNVLISAEQAKAQAAQNNLYAISAGQQRYFENYNTYCVQVGCGDTTANLNSNLRLGLLSSDNFNYTCSAVPVLYTCTASDGQVQLTVTQGQSVQCAIVGPGGSCP